MNVTIFKSLNMDFRINEIFVFGNHSIQSDIDVLIVSDDFANISRTKRKMLIKKSSSKLDPICLTTKEFNKLKNSKSSLWNKISTQGQRIKYER